MLLCGIELSSAILLYGAYTEEVCCAASEAVRMESSRQPCCYSTFAADRTSTKHLHELGKTTTYGDVFFAFGGIGQSSSSAVSRKFVLRNRVSVFHFILSGNKRC